MRNGGGRMEPRKANPQELTGTTKCRGQRKRENRTREEVEETGSLHKAAGTNRELGSKLRASR